MEKFLFVLLLIFLLGTSCGQFDSRVSQAPKGEFKPESVVVKGDVNKNHIRFRGSLWKAVSWEDARGKNTLILSARPVFQISEDLHRKRVYGYHYLETPDTLERINYMTDLADSCFCDCDIYLVDTLLHVDDFNNDQIGDVWFAYYIDKRCDVSPVEAKLQLWSDGKRVELAGLVPPPEDQAWSDSLPGPEFVFSSDVHLEERAKTLWKELFY